MREVSIETAVAHTLTSQPKSQPGARGRRSEWNGTSFHVQHLIGYPRVEKKEWVRQTGDDPSPRPISLSMNGPVGTSHFQANPNPFSVLVRTEYFDFQKISTIARPNDYQEVLVPLSFLFTSLTKFSTLQN